MQSCVFSLDNLLKQIYFLICSDKWLSFIPPSLRPGPLAFGTPLGAAQGLCFGSTLENVTVSRCTSTWPSVSTCSESSGSGSTPRAQQGSLATRSLLEFLGSYLKRPFVRQHWACFKTWRVSCKASSHSSGSSVWKQSPVNHLGGKIQQMTDRALWKCGSVYFARVDSCVAGRTSTEISSAPYQNTVVRDINLWCYTSFSHQILITYFAQLIPSQIQ